MPASTPVPSPAWGSASGFLPLASASRVADAAASWVIGERISTYAWAFDERRRELLSTCFTEDAVWHGSLAGIEPVPPIRGREAIVDWLTAYWDRQTDQRRHLLMSTQIDPLGADRARATCSLLLTAVETELRIALTSFYRVELTRIDGDWLIDDLFEGGDVPF